MAHDEDELVGEPCRTQGSNAWLDVLDSNMAGNCIWQASASAVGMVERNPGNLISEKLSPSLFKMDLTSILIPGSFESEKLHTGCGKVRERSISGKDSPQASKQDTRIRLVVGEESIEDPDLDVFWGHV